MGSNETATKLDNLGRLLEELDGPVQRQASEISNLHDSLQRDFPEKTLTKTLLIEKQAINVKSF